MKAIDEHLLRHFGSREAAEQFAHLYVLETEPMKIVTDGEDAPTLTASTRYRLRMKTVDELRHDTEVEDTA